MTGSSRTPGALSRLLGRLRGTGGAPRPGSADGEPTIVYAPDLDGDPDPGEVVWTWVPYVDDPTQGKDRPVLVIGWSGDELAAVPLSSKDHGDRPDGDEWIEVGRGGWDREGRTSYADAGRLLHVAPREVRREGAILARSRFDAVVHRVQVLHRWRG
jgi:hypothetical protein